MDRKIYQENYGKKLPEGYGIYRPRSSSSLLYNFQNTCRKQCLEIAVTTWAALTVPNNWLIERRKTSQTTSQVNLKTVCKGNVEEIKNVTDLIGSTYLHN
ncbi:hypothetical protein LOAG_04886 [Loa loa]|uniref:Uncharacterized protein n=1 Tax=Loa loa TaxID=7209 RepID=A0A1S0U0Y1_LOALO|nr:hypothetical protein LOAG_04886 [Loa loa]EFO23602.1 hypothetical protein LOAG_04886 [Loa loa]